MCRFENRHLKAVSDSHIITFPIILKEDAPALTEYSLDVIASLVSKLPKSLAECQKQPISRKWTLFGHFEKKIVYNKCFSDDKTLKKATA